ncbi:STAS/SEC14 domain-containing protein [Roseibium limicola]|uniref:STAS/SEC14 domain-containing protein n=1 Tax=Roseibium limicola TaxID=2816037 RepID=A0A939ESJ9_9HYPH|nr:STAS/SEC14 domain-containing protein [Roseibium limicola]MBO0347131.1 STAS/SEC14 domain-containing protein [Roseibium limicola]
MFTIEKPAPNRLDLSLSGKLEAAEMDKALDEIEALSADIEDGVMFYDVIDFHMPALAALKVEFSRMPKLFRMVGKFRRCAVLSDEAWLRSLSELESKFIPGLEIKAFQRNQRSEAEAWLTAE